jgi:hypothetical protein
MDPDPYLRLSDPDSDPAPEPAIFSSDFQDSQQPIIFFLLITFYTHLSHFLNTKSPKEVTKQQESMLFLQFLLENGMIGI